MTHIGQRVLILSIQPLSLQIYDTMLGDCVDTGVVNITKAVHNYAVDYASMNMTDLASTNEMIAKQKTYFGENSIGFSMPASDILKGL